MKKLQILAGIIFLSSFAYAQSLSVQVNGGLIYEKYQLSEKNTIWDDSWYFSGGFPRFSLEYAQGKNALSVSYSIFETTRPSRLVSDKYSSSAKAPEGEHSEYSVRLRRQLFAWNRWAISASLTYAYQYMKYPQSGSFQSGSSYAENEAVIYHQTKLTTEKRGHLIGLGTAINYQLNDYFSLVTNINYFIGLDKKREFQIKYDDNEAFTTPQLVNMSSDGRYISFEIGVKYTFFRK